MIVDSKYLNKMRQNMQRISEELENILIDRLGEEPEPYTFSEQDLYEQTRKIIMRYDSSPKGRLELIYGVDKLERQLEILQSKIWHELSENKEDF